MKGNVALIKEQGVNFAVLVVKRHVLSSPTERENTRTAFEQEFGVSVVLMTQDSKGVPTYSGRNDLVRWLSSVYVEALPWREFTLN